LAFNFAFAAVAAAAGVRVARGLTNSEINPGFIIGFYSLKPKTRFSNGKKLGFFQPWHVCTFDALDLAPNTHYLICIWGMVAPPPHYMLCENHDFYKNFSLPLPQGFSEILLTSKELFFKFGFLYLEAPWYS